METDFVRNTPHPVPTGTTFDSEISMETPVPPITRVQDASCASSTAVSAWALSRTRRMIDGLVALIALIVFSPLMTMAAVAVLLSSPGPVLFKQQRMGRGGCAFTLYKLRSMRTDFGLSSPITVSGDVRITRIGKFLRKYKLDELPQFWNVLLGDMSLVGPRPKLPHHEGLRMPFRPGITGAATLTFRFEEEMLSQIPRQHLDAYYERFVKPSKARIDWEYMRSATPKSDISILWKTAKACFSDVENGCGLELPNFDDTAHEFL